MNHTYQDKLNQHMNDIHNLMFVFEVTKCCGYSTFITVYKNQTLTDLYSNIISHFGDNIQIKELYFISPEQQRFDVPVSKKTVSEFIRTNIICNPIRLAPVYELPSPTIYRLYLNDGQCTQQHTTNYVG
jgi:hypothetical protein